MPPALSSDDEADVIVNERRRRPPIGDGELDLGAMAIVSTVCRAASAIRNHIENHVLAEHNLSWSAAKVLHVLWTHGAQESRHLAAEAGVTKGTLTGVVNTLEKRGLCRRRPHSGDRRLVLVELTSEGTRTMDGLFPELAHQQAVVAEGLDDDSRQQLATALHRLMANAGLPDRRAPLGMDPRILGNGHEPPAR